MNINCAYPNYAQKQNNKYCADSPYFKGGQSLCSLNPINYQAKKLFMRSQEASHHRIHDVIPRLKSYTKEIKVGQSYAWDINPNDRKKYLIVLHGTSQNISNLQILYKAVAEDTDYAIFAPEYRGFGKNPQCKLSEKALTEDTNNAIKYLNTKGIKSSDIAILGHSFGGFLAAKATKDNSDLEKLILVSPIASIDSQVINYNAITRNKLSKFAKFLLVNFKILRKSLKKILRMDNYVKTTNIPIDIIHSKHDNVVNVESAYELSKLCKNLEGIYILQDSSHIMDKAKVNAIVTVLNKKKQ